MNELDFLEAPAKTPSTVLEEVMAVVRQLEKATETREIKEKELEQAKEAERKLSEDILPDLLERNRLATLVLDNGKRVDVKEELFISIPEDPVKRSEAFKWLASHGAGDLIHDTVAVEDPTIGLIKFLEERDVVYGREKKVNGSQLKAWFKDALGMTKKSKMVRMSYQDIPEAFSKFRLKKAVIKNETK